MSPSISVIVCCYTEARLPDVLRAVASVWRQRYAPGEVIVVVDNNPRLYQTLKGRLDGQVRLLLNMAEQGLCASRNVGIVAASGELLAFLDDDAVATPDWLERLTLPFADPSVLAVGGRALLSWESARPRWLPTELEWVVGGGYTWLPQREMAVRNPHGHNMCFRRQALEAVGGFDTAMGRVGNGGYAGEEAEVCLRLRRAFPEGKVLYQPGAAVVHKVPRARATFRYLLRRAYAEGLCKGRLARLAGWSSLESERHYLRHVLLKALPARLFRPWSATSLAQAVALLACVAAVAAGYLVGRLGADRPGRSPGVRR